jgi:hypothetical protein
VLVTVTTTPPAVGQKRQLQLPEAGGCRTHLDDGDLLTADGETEELPPRCDPAARIATPAGVLERTADASGVRHWGWAPHLLAGGQTCREHGGSWPARLQALPPGHRDLELGHVDVGGAQPGAGRARDSARTARSRSFRARPSARCMPGSCPPRGHDGSYWRPCRRTAWRPAPGPGRSRIALALSRSWLQADGSRGVLAEN